MKDRKVYLVILNDERWVTAVFDSKEKAEEYLKDTLQDSFGDYYIEEHDIF